jgi:hypothetical protein
LWTWIWIFACGWSLVTSWPAMFIIRLTSVLLMSWSAYLFSCSRGTMLCSDVQCKALMNCCILLCWWIS